MSQWGQGWGTWHPGAEARARCPQCNRFHTTDEALALNAKDTEYRRARAWARHKTWIGEGP